MKIDAHHHFWKYDPREYAWIGESMTVLRRDFLPGDLPAEIRSAGIDGVVSVQARPTVAETDRLLELGREHSFVRGVVGWVPLAADDLSATLDRFRQHALLKGVRHVVQDEPDDNFILGDDFNRGVAKLKAAGLVYDILIFARHLPQTIRFVDRHPDQVFVLDHIAKPEIRGSQADPQWSRNIAELAKRGNVYCKFSGVVTEVRDEQWSLDAIRPYWDAALQAFSPDRLMFGTDWPVCLLRSSYRDWHQAVRTLAASLTETEQNAIFGETAVHAYGLHAA